MQNAELDEAQTGIKIAWRNINNLRYADDTTLMAESKEELKSLLRKVKKESEKAGLKLNIKRTKIMASGPITAWQIDGETMETVRYFIFLGSKITAVSPEGVVGLHRTVQLQLHQHDWLGHRLGLLCCPMACLSNEQRSFCRL